MKHGLHCRIAHDHHHSSECEQWELGIESKGMLLSAEQKWGQALTSDVKITGNFGVLACAFVLIKRYAATNINAKIGSDYCIADRAINIHIGTNAIAIKSIGGARDWKLCVVSGCVSFIAADDLLSCNSGPVSVSDAGRGAAGQERTTDPSRDDVANVGGAHH